MNKQALIQIQNRLTMCISGKDIKIIGFIFLSLSCITTMSGQHLKNTAERKENFFDVQESMNEYYAAHPGTKEEKHWRRFEHFYADRVFPHGDLKVLNQAQTSAHKELKRSLDHNNRGTHGDWQFMGPSNLTTSNFGRCVRIRFVPSDTNIVFILTSSAGLWKTTNGGSTWENLTEDLPYLFGIDFVMNANNPDSIFLLTGNSKASYGIASTQGVYVTQNGGETWSVRNPFEDSPWAWRLVMHPSNSSIMFAGTTSGIYRTTDAWKTATLVKSAFDVFDIEYKPGSETIMYASSQRNFYRSDNSGILGSWNKIVDTNLFFLDTMVRTDIGVSQDNPDCIYLVGSNNNRDYVLRSLNSGVGGSWTVQDSTTDLWWGQAKYNMGIAVDPNNYERVFVMAIAIWRSTDSGVTGSWTDVVSTHADHHDFGYQGGTLFDLNDGGVAKSTDGGDSWSHITPGIEVFEAYSVSGTPQNTSLYITGAQDTGGNRIDAGGAFSGICQTCTGDVTMTLIDFTNEDKAYMACQGGGLRFTSNGWSSDQDAGPGGANFEPEFGDGNWICPYEFDPVFPNYIFTGKDSMWRLNIDAQTAQYLGYPGAGKTKAIAQGKNNRGRMYLIHGGKMYRTNEALTEDSAGASWAEIINDDSVGVSLVDILVDPDNADKIYVVYSGTRDGYKVYHSTNSGNPGTWVNISGGLPNVPANKIAFHENGSGNHALYLGTDLGVYYLDDSMADWVYFGNNLPASPVSDLFINTASSEIIAATVGRGIWKADTYSTCPPGHFLFSNEHTGGKRHYSASLSITSTRSYDEAFSTNIHYQAGDFVDMLPGFRVIAPAFFHAKIGECPSLNEED